jgi:hypothetical protein
VISDVFPSIRWISATGAHRRKPSSSVTGSKIWIAIDFENPIEVLGSFLEWIFAFDLPDL